MAAAHRSACDFVSSKVFGLQMIMFSPIMHRIDRLQSCCNVHAKSGGSKLPLEIAGTLGGGISGGVDLLPEAVLKKLVACCRMQRDTNVDH